jgi:hypothetical protein
VFTAPLLRASARCAQKIEAGAAIAMLLFCATPLAGQSLSELSRQMEQKRSAAALDGLLAYPHRAGAEYFGSTEVVDLVITMPLVQRMTGAWSAVLQAELKDVTLARRFRQAALAAKNAGELERVTAGERAIQGAISASGITVHEFVTTKLACQLATDVLARKYPAGLVDYGNVGPNTRFLGDHRSEIDTLLRTPSKLERDLDAALDANARK